MSKKSETVDQEQAEGKQHIHSRQEIDRALARLQEIAESLPPLDVVEIVREGRDARPNN